MTNSPVLKTLYVTVLAVWLPIQCLGQTPAQAPVNASTIRLDPAFDAIVAPDAKVEKIAGGFKFVEGPVWVRKPGYLLFSDIPENVIDKWSPDGNVSSFIKPSGFTGDDPTKVGSPINNGFATVILLGSNGVTLDPKGLVVFCAHGDRDVVRIEKNGSRTVLAASYEGKRLNSPNDLVYKKDGTLYFTDPPAGVSRSLKELAFNGVYSIKNGKLQLATKDVSFPNGLAFSPDEHYLYVDDTQKSLIMRFEVQSDGVLTNGQLFYDMSEDKRPGLADGMKVDTQGNIYCTGHGGIMVISPSGKHLGTIVVPEMPANVGFGDADGKTLYIPARTGLYRVHVNVAGIYPLMNK